MSQSMIKVYKEDNQQQLIGGARIIEVAGDKRVCDLTALLLLHGRDAIVTSPGRFLKTSFGVDPGTNYILLEVGDLFFASFFLPFSFNAKSISLVLVTIWTLLISPS